MTNDETLTMREEFRAGNYTISKLSKREGFTYLPETAEFIIDGLYGRQKWQQAMAIARKQDNGYKILYCEECKASGSWAKGFLSKIDDSLCHGHRMEAMGEKRRKKREIETKKTAVPLSTEIIVEIDKQAKIENLSRSAFCAKIITEVITKG